MGPSADDSAVGTCWGPSRTPLSTRHSVSGAGCGEGRTTRGWAEDLRARPLRVRRNVLEELVDGQRLMLPARRLVGDGLEAWA